MMLRHYRSMFMACTAAFVFSNISIAYSQNAQQSATTGNGEETTTLETIVVKGKRVQPGSVADTPLATQTTAEDIRNNKITSITDLGNTTEPGVGVGSTGAGVNIRGLDGNRVLTTIDGIPIPFLSNNARQGGGATPLGAATQADGGIDTFDFSSLSTVDIMRGADSSRAGSGALGGAMLLRTLEPEDLIEAGRDWGGLAKATYDSENKSLGGSLAIAKKTGPTSILFQGGYTRGHERDSKGSDSRLGSLRTEPNPADFDQNNLLFKVRHDFENGHVLGLTAERFDRDRDTDLKTDYGTGRSYSDLLGDDENRRTRVSIDYRYNASDNTGLVNRADLTLYWQEILQRSIINGTRTGALAGPWYRNNEMKDQSFGLTGSMSSSVEAGGLSHEITVGGGLSFTDSTQYTAGDDVCVQGGGSPISCGFHHVNQSDMPDVNAWRLGVFVDDKIILSDSRFSLTPGLRFDWYDFSPQDSAGFRQNSGYASGGLPKGQSDFQFSPKLLATYEVTPDVELFAQYSMGFRSPSVTELYLDYAKTAAPGTYQVLGNPDLKPETSHGFELGARFGDNDFGGRVTVFHNRYRNFIETINIDSTGTGFDTTQQAVNLNRVQISGAEVRAHKYFENGFSIHGAVSYAYGKNMETDELLDSVPPLKGIAGLGYSAENWGTNLSFIGVAAVSDRSSATFKPEGYGIVNLTGWWEPEQVKGMRVQAGVYNIFDKEYYNAVKWRDVNLASANWQPRSYYSEPGRTFKISLTQKF